MCILIYADNMKCKPSNVMIVNYCWWSVMNSKAGMLIDP